LIGSPSGVKPSIGFPQIQTPFKRLKSTSLKVHFQLLQQKTYLRARIDSRPYIKTAGLI
jgi:hypothetical protein